MQWGNRMKIRLKIDNLWLELEKKSMRRLLEKYREWETKTLEKAKRAKDLHTLRELFYELGDRWEWDQVTGEWLSKGAPLDAITFLLRVPGLKQNKERYVLYAVMAYSKGFTDQFDHLGDKERVIIERDTSTGKIVAWSTTGHGAMDLHPTDLRECCSIDDVIRSCHLVAQPGDHALRLSPPLESSGSWNLIQHLWQVASGHKEFAWRKIDIVSAEDIEEGLDFKFFRYANAVISLERAWNKLKRDPTITGREVLPHLRQRNVQVLRKIEGLLYLLWFRPPAYQLQPAFELLNELKNRLDTEYQGGIEGVIIPYLDELVQSLNDLVEKAKFLKWKSVVEQKGYTPESTFDKLGITGMAREALVVALDDILKEHTLSYIAYPERATISGKVMRIILGVAVLPARLFSAFIASASLTIKKLKTRLRLLFAKARSESSPDEQASTSEDVEAHAV